MAIVYKSGNQPVVRRPKMRRCSLSYPRSAAPFRWAAIGDISLLLRSDRRQRILCRLPTEGTVAHDQSDVLRGTLDLLILKTLTLEPMHGWGIGARLEQFSRGVLDVTQGS